MEKTSSLTFKFLIPDAKMLLIILAGRIAMSTQTKAVASLFIWIATGVISKMW